MQLRALLRDADGVAIANEVMQSMHSQGVQEGDAAEMEVASLTALLEDEDVSERDLTALAPDLAALCEQHGWPKAPFSRLGSKGQSARLKPSRVNGSCQGPLSAVPILWERPRAVIELGGGRPPPPQPAGRGGGAGGM